MENNFKIIEVTIPDKFYKYGKPTRCDYFEYKNEGIRYIADIKDWKTNTIKGQGEEMCSLLSIYVLGEELHFKKKEFIAVDLEAKKITIKVYDKDLN